LTENEKHIILGSNNLTIGYAVKKQQTVIARDINISLEKAKLVCLLGKNGIGKSTLLRTISKVQPSLSGDLFIENKKIEQISAKALSQKMSLVLTERIPESNLTVYELIALGRQPYTNWIGNITDQDEQYIQQAIERVNIESLQGQKCDELSDGQLQKVMIARALAQNTELIILDEPTAHLDIHHKIEVFNLLQTLVKDLGKTIITSTHEVQLALQLADTLWLMTEQNFTSGKTQDLINHGSLDTLFSSELVEFDLKTKQFIVKKPE
jgi:iron complex transport system ATP-binding protein